MSARIELVVTFTRMNYFQYLVRNAALFNRIWTKPMPNEPE